MTMKRPDEPLAASAQARHIIMRELRQLQQQAHAANLLTAEAAIAQAASAIDQTVDAPSLHTICATLDELELLRALLGHCLNGGAERRLRLQALSEASERLSTCDLASLAYVCDHNMAHLRGFLALFDQGSNGLQSV